MWYVDSLYGWHVLSGMVVVEATGKELAFLPTESQGVKALMVRPLFISSFYSSSQFI